MTQITIRKARKEDTAWLAEHIRELISEPDRYIAFEPDEVAGVAKQQCNILTESLNRDDMLYLVAEIDGNPAGEIVLQRGTLHAYQHFVTLGITVKKRWRHQGIGRRLMEEALAWAKTNPWLRRIELWVDAENAPAISLYTKCGFQIEGLRQQAVFYNGTFHDELIMALLLPGGKS